MAIKVKKETDTDFLGIDLGTSACRIAALDAQGAVKAFASAPLTPPHGAPPHREQHPEDWWSALREALAMLAQHGDLRRCRALAIAGTSGSLLVTDDAGEPLGPALLYHDARAGQEAREIAHRIGVDHPASAPTASLPKLMWILRHASNPRIRHALHPADWLTGRLLGRFDTGDEHNALKLGYDPLARVWPGAVRALAAPIDLPVIVPAGTALGRIAPAVSRELGLPGDLTIVAGTTDSTAACLATGASQPGDAVTVLGSTLVLKVLAPRPVWSGPHGVYSHRLGDLWLAGGASNSGGAVLARFFDADAIARLSARIDPDIPTGLDFYPLPAPGERFPVCDPALPARLEPRPADPARFLQGMLEGLARIEAEGYARLAALGAPKPIRVITTGTGARNETWRRLRAHALGLDPAIAGETEAAVGAARLARRGQQGHHG